MACCDQYNKFFTSVTYGRSRVRKPVFTTLLGTMITTSLKHLEAAVALNSTVVSYARKKFVKLSTA